MKFSQSTKDALAEKMVTGPLIAPSIPEVMADSQTFEINYDPPQDLSHLPIGTLPCASG